MFFDMYLILKYLGSESDIYEKLKNGSIENGHFKVFKKDDYPSRWHYKNNLRSPPILVLANMGYGLDDLIIAAAKIAEENHFTCKFKHN
jgi:hypothetical protein